MDRDFIARNQIVERYISGRLPIKGASGMSATAAEADVVRPAVDAMGSIVRDDDAAGALAAAVGVRVAAVLLDLAGGGAGMAALGAGAAEGGVVAEPVAWPRSATGPRGPVVF
jgi:hypothetical protein